MLAVRENVDGAHQHHLGVVLIKLRVSQHVRGVYTVAGRQMQQRLCVPRWGLEQALAVWVVVEALQDGARSCGNALQAFVGRQALLLLDMFRHDGNVGGRGRVRRGRVRSGRGRGDRRGDRGRRGARLAAPAGAGAGAALVQGSALATVAGGRLPLRHGRGTKRLRRG